MADTVSLDFSSVAEIEVPVKVRDSTYTLREASGEAAAKYRSAAAACMKMVDGKTVGISGIGEVESLLVSLCLFDDKNKLVKRELINSWPAKIVKALFERCKEISGLDEDASIESLKKQRDKLNEQIKTLEDDALGNSSSNTTDGSE